MIGIVQFVDWLTRTSETHNIHVVWGFKTVTIMLKRLVCLKDNLIDRYGLRRWCEDQNSQNQCHIYVYVYMYIYVYMYSLYAI